MAGASAGARPGAGANWQHPTLLGLHDHLFRVRAFLAPLRTYPHSTNRPSSSVDIYPMWRSKVSKVLSVGNIRVAIREVSRPEIALHNEEFQCPHAGE